MNKSTDICGKYEFITYTANRYGIDFSEAEYILDMFTSSYEDIAAFGKQVEIEGFGKVLVIPSSSENLERL